MTSRLCAVPGKSFLEDRRTGKVELCIRVNSAIEALTPFPCACVESIFALGLSDVGPTNGRTNRAYSQDVEAGIQSTSGTSNNNSDFASKVVTIPCLIAHSDGSVRGLVRFERATAADAPLRMRV
ncbi:hypothetical protein CAPTEDRAFT_222535 [Capitella teleta]|uniref:Uncharacterized protein n=1 Tax=Capitella teleta TaxID=283909 RepID=R7VGG0_CAPTE|nr:hypothetical protein CAPTEDRAFT_222535 [Capitella teleta]|eukprot:ELU17938.1 hypothetical protein CAPTEDRAFT_222535 [Capitella teleta]